MTKTSDRDGRRAVTEEPWAVVSLRITSTTLTAQQIEGLLGTASSGRPGADAWSADLTADRELRLDDQLRLAKDWLRERSAALQAMSGADIGLLIGWTPRTPQDGIVVDRELIALLHSVGGYVLLDTYLD
jgi:hypothetical protein